MHALFDGEGGLDLIVQDNGYLYVVIAIYGAVGDHDPMIGGHATLTGDKTKGALREVDVHASVNFLCLTGFDGDLFNNVEVICSRFLGGYCGDSYFVMDEEYSGIFEVIGYVAIVWFLVSVLEKEISI